MVKIIKTEGQLVGYAKEMDKLEYIIAVEPHANADPITTTDNYGISIEKITISETCGDNVVILDGNLLGKPNSRALIKEILEGKNYHTYNGRWDVALLLTQGIKLNLYLEWGKSCKRDNARTIIDKVVTEISMGQQGTSGLLEFEKGKALHFGINIDVDLLNHQIKREEENNGSVYREVLNKLTTSNDAELSKEELRDKVGELIGCKATKRNLKTIMTKENDSPGIAKVYYEYIQSDLELTRLKEIASRVNGSGMIGLSRLPDRLMGYLLFNVETTTGNEILVKPSKGYSLIKVSYPGQLACKIIFKLAKGLDEQRDYFTYIASKVFKKEEGEITGQERLAIKYTMVSYGRKPSGTKTIRDHFNLTMGDLYDYGELSKETNTVIDTLKAEVHGIHDAGDLPMEIQNKIATKDGLFELLRIDNFSKAEKHLANKAIVDISNYFGKNNFRIRLLRQLHGSLVYEVAKGEVEDFKKCLNEIGLHLGDSTLELEIDRVINS